MTKEVRKLVKSIEQGITRRGFFFVFDKHIGLIAESVQHKQGGKTKAVTEFANTYGWKARDARNVGAFLFIPANSQEDHWQPLDDFLENEDLKESSLSRVPLNGKSRRLMQTRYAKQ